MASRSMMLQTERASGLPMIWKAGLIAGALDGFDAAIFIGIVGGKGVLRVFQFIASGLLGTRSFQEGWRSGALGLMLHFFIATAAAAAYYDLSRRIPFFLERPLLGGTVFGISFFAFMHYVVVKLSAAPSRPFGTIDLINQLFAHIFFVGLPIALITGRESHKQRRSGS
jgi:hypothetical protein